MEILRVENLKKIYKTGENVVNAVNDVSFTVNKGEFVAIIGASGSGKSTLLHLIGGVDKPDSGKIDIDGVDLYSQSKEKLAIFRRREVGLIYQFYNLISVLTVKENITLPLLMDKRKVNEKELKEMIEMLSLTGKENQLPNELSGGQQQRVAIGRSLITSPAIVLADEPTGNLDSKSSADIINLLKKSNRDFNQTLIMVTHDNNIAELADRIIEISDGKIVRDEVIKNERF